MKPGRKTREKRRESNDEPFGQIERLKKNPFHQLECFTKRFKDFDFWVRSIHGGHCETLFPWRSTPKSACSRSLSEFGVNRVVGQPRKHSGVAMSKEWRA